MPTPVDPNDPAYISAKRKMVAGMVILQGLTALTPTTDDDDLLIVAQEVMTEHFDEVYALIQKRRAIRAGK